MLRALPAILIAYALLAAVADASDHGEPKNPSCVVINFQEAIRSKLKAANDTEAVPPKPIPDKDLHPSGFRLYPESANQLPISRYRMESATSGAPGLPSRWFEGRDSFGFKNNLTFSDDGHYAAYSIHTRENHDISISPEAPLTERPKFGSIFVYDAKNGNFQKQIDLPDDTTGIRFTRFVPHTDLVAVGLEPLREIQLYSVKSGKLVGRLSGPGIPGSLEFSADGKNAMVDWSVAHSSRPMVFPSEMLDQAATRGANTSAQAPRLTIPESEHRHGYQFTKLIGSDRVLTIDQTGKAQIHGPNGVEKTYKIETVNNGFQDFGASSDGAWTVFGIHTTRKGADSAFFNLYDKTGELVAQPDYGNLFPGYESITTEDIQVKVQPKLAVHTGGVTNRFGADLLMATFSVAQKDRPRETWTVIWKIGSTDDEPEFVTKWNVTGQFLPAFK